MYNEPENKPERIGQTPFGLLRIGRCYRIAEIVTPSGAWITWEGLYTTRLAALREIVRETRNRDIEIMSFIEETQRGKTGIYPHRVAEAVSSRFFIPLEDASEYVIRHIREVMNQSM